MYLLPKQIPFGSVITGVRLHVDPPFLRVQLVHLQGPSLAQPLNFIDELVSAIVAPAGVALGVLVGETGTEAVQDGPAGEVLGERGDKVIYKIHNRSVAGILERGVSRTLQLAVSQFSAQSVDSFLLHDFLWLSGSALVRNDTLNRCARQ